MITVEHLTKRYGDFTAVRDLSFEIDEGHVYGFLGPNGAGKSTTLNMMTGCLSATEGHVKIGGYDIFENPTQAKKLIGYLPETPPLYLNETPEEYLHFVGEAKGLKGAELTEQIQEVINKTKIQSVSKKRISSLSKGFKQRVGIAQALLGNPKVIILDEPTVGLDPIQIVEIRELIKQLGQDHTVIFSSHILSEVQNICESILIISKGKLMAFDKPEKLEEKLLGSNELSFTTEASPEETSEILHELDGITQVKSRVKDNGYNSCRLTVDCSNIYDFAKELFFAFAAHKKALLEVNLKKADLEEVFMELTSNSENVEDAPTEDTAGEEGSSKETEEEEII